MSNYQTRGIHESIVHVQNVMPNLTEEELLADAGLDLLIPMESTPFRRHWQFGGTLGKETVNLAPGESALLRASEAAAAKLTWEHQGVMFLPYEDTSDEVKVKEAEIEAVSKAQRFYADRGRPKIAKYRRDRSLSEQDVEDMKNDLWPLFLHVAIGDRLAEHVKALRKELAALKKARKAEVTETAADAA